MPVLVSAGRRRHLVTLQPMKTIVTDGAPELSPDEDQAAIPVQAAIEPATDQNLARAVAGTTLPIATHLVTIPYVPNITTQFYVLFGTRSFSVSSVQNPDERNRELVLVCSEIVQ